MIEPSRSFDRAAEEYERTRPDYPPRVLDLVPVGADAEVLDVGAGTGKLTRVLARRYARVTAIEPLDGMRAILERVVPGVEALAGRAEQLPLPEGAVDAVFAGQAFHWFANDDAVAELARVLRSDGVLCLVWNAPDEERPSPLPKAYVTYLDELRAERSVLTDTPPFEEVIQRGRFGAVHKGSIAHEHVLDRVGLLDNARSVSWIASRDDDERARVMERLATLLPEGTYAVPNVANVLWARRR